MRTFELHRLEDETGISGTGLVAEGVEFTDGTAALRWRTKVVSHGTYASMADLEAIHGHGGKTRVIWTGAPYERGIRNYFQDRIESACYQGIGGSNVVGSPPPETPKAPDYIAPSEAAEYVRGYIFAAKADGNWPR